MGPQPSFNQDDIHPPNYDILSPVARQANKYGKFFHTNPGMEDFSGTDYLEMYDKFKDAADAVAPGVAEAWQSLSQELARVSYEFAYRAGMVSGWEGKAAEAAAQNRVKSQSAILATLGAARYMNSEVSVFRQTIEAVGKALRDNRENYRAEVEDNKDTESKNRNYQVYAQTTRNLMSQSYAPPVRAVSDQVPSLDMSKPDVGTAPAGPSGPGPGPGGGTPPGTLSPNGSGSPVMPTSTGLNLPNKNKQTQNPNNTQNQGNPASKAANQATQGASTAAKGAGDTAKSAADAAKNAAQQASKQLLDKLTNAAGLPEGVLGLGPKGLTPGLSKAGGGPGGGSPVGARELPAGKPSPQITPASKATGTPTTAARAGLSSAPGGSGGGSGAPAAGHRAGGDDKIYKGSKALRRQQHGEEIVGETEAVIPVVGAKPADSAGNPAGQAAGGPNK
ncbi:Uncharacterised protein [Mycolicibacterium fortuitum]|uniref:Uncharacterized protein n=1 Tax=Mycolicibacterium fortuitum TaxID=1766 RepID=A0A378WE34_MYCFO|nr:Uncharacterised protein [Mycolicibacterium fortuitum]